MLIYKSISRRIFEVFLYAGFIVFCASIILPFLNVIALSLSSANAIIMGKVRFIPKEFYPNAYRIILRSSIFIRSLLNTVFLTVVKTFLTITIALAAGYALSNKHFYGVRVAFIYILVTMYFSGGLIPFYIMVNSYGLNNTYGALIFVNIVVAFYIIVFRNAITRLPSEITESAEIDGASEFAILFKIIIHLIMPMIMAFTIFSAVNYWNEWFNVLIFIRDKSKWTLQYMLRNLYMNPTTGQAELDATLADDPKAIHPQNLIMAAIMCTTIPILVIYPFLQKYFIHGVIVGAVKG